MLDLLNRHLQIIFLFVGLIHGGCAAHMVTASDGEAIDDADGQREMHCQTISVDGFCGIEFGMSLDEAMSALPGGLDGIENVDLEDEFDAACFYLGAREIDDRVSIMFVQKVVERIDVFASGVATPEGARVGLSLDEVEALFENVERVPHFYDSSNTDLVVTLDDTMLAIFEGDHDNLVNSFRIGRNGPARYVEGCS